MSLPLGVYDPSRVIVSVGSVTVTGWGADAMVKCSRNANAIDLTMGAGGDGAVTISSDLSGTIELTLLNTSPSNALLSAIAGQTEQGKPAIVPFSVKDLSLNTLVIAATAWIKKIPDVERAKMVGETVWTLETNRLIITL